jgi:hypothetical protein
MGKTTCTGHVRKNTYKSLFKLSVLFLIPQQKFEIERQDPIEISTNEFQEHPFRGLRVCVCIQTDVSVQRV